MCSRVAMLGFVLIVFCLPATRVARAQVPAEDATRDRTWLPADYAYDETLLPGERYAADVPTAEQLLGFEIGERPARQAEVEHCLRAWASSSERVTLHEYARSHEGRGLFYVVVTSEGNQGRIEQIKEANARRADPRGAEAVGEDHPTGDMPAVAWMAYCIHGDELSGTDAALAAVYHLAACEDDHVRRMLDELVIIFDPLMNPDGRDRFIGMMDQFRGRTPVLDRGAVQHRGDWPRGRHNHYLFDLNRDWVWGVHPETRGRMRAVAAWNPQLFIDGHEMGSGDTFLFNPPREPFHPRVSAQIHKWWDIFADECGAAFDEHGWAYYTREWLEFWYPGYSDSWAVYHGSIGILYEQASTGGSAVLQPNGKVLTYAEAVHHQLTATLANLRTLRENRTRILADYVAQKRAGMQPAEDDEGAWFIVPGDQDARTLADFGALLRTHGLIVRVASEPVAATDALSSLKRREPRVTVPAGSLVVYRYQPSAPLVGALLDFDPRMSDAFLQTERESLVKRGRSKLYDVTAWNLAMAWGLRAYWAAEIERPDVLAAFDAEALRSDGGVAEMERPFGWVLDAEDGAFLPAAVRLLQHGVKVRIGEKAFRAAGREFARGSVLIRRIESDAALRRVMGRVADEYGVQFHAAASARSPNEGPDLGGNDFELLARPRAALVTAEGTSTTSSGSAWHYLDHELGLDVSLIEAVDLRRTDLRDYNVIVVPEAWGSTVRDALEGVDTWVRGGGTLVLLGSAAYGVTREGSKLSDVRRRRDVLDKLDEYAAALALEQAAERVHVDPANIWDALRERLPLTTQPAWAKEAPEGRTRDEDAEENGAQHGEPVKLEKEALDRWRRRFSPSGVIVRGLLKDDHWLTGGCPQEMPLFAAGSTVLLHKSRNETPVRMAPRAALRLSGLLWPEAATRMADGAYTTVERRGNGQVILFAYDPVFRGGWRGTRRLLGNAVILGPGIGANVSRP